MLLVLEEEEEEEEEDLAHQHGVSSLNGSSVGGWVRKSEYVFKSDLLLLLLDNILLLLLVVVSHRLLRFHCTAIILLIFVYVL